jgi:hypothetical protein
MSTVPQTVARLHRSPVRAFQQNPAFPIEVGPSVCSDLSNIGPWLGSIDWLYDGVFEGGQGKQLGTTKSFLGLREIFFGVVRQNEPPVTDNPILFLANGRRTLS